MFGLSADTSTDRQSFLSGLDGTIRAGCFVALRLTNPAELGATLETKRAIFKFQRRSINCWISLSFEYEPKFDTLCSNGCA
jgi:hypothetical protein